MSKKIVVNGCFDLLHRGHIDLLIFARSIGDYLLVCIDSDEMIKQSKGFSRPIFNQQERKYILENLKPVDEVRIFNSHAHLREILKDYQADAMVKGDDYINSPIVGSDLVKSIEFFKKINGYSTTKIIEDIVNR
jgi:rfaE bifunctional protein nucleotidyltransferase chain/domain